MTTKIDWVETATCAPIENQVVLVHGGVAKYRNGVFYTGMEEPAYARPIQWPVTHWAFLDDLRPSQ